MKPKPLNPDTPAALIETPGGYADWLAELKLRCYVGVSSRRVPSSRNTRLKAAKKPVLSID